MLYPHTSADGGMRCSDDGSVVHQLQRAMDLEETDKDTLHLLVFLFMQFLSQPQHVGFWFRNTNSCFYLLNFEQRHHLEHHLICLLLGELKLLVTVQDNIKNGSELAKGVGLTSLLLLSP